MKVPFADGMVEMCLRCGDEASYAHWLSGCKLASRNGSVSAEAVSNEVGSILGRLQAQLHGFGHGSDVAEGGKAGTIGSRGGGNEGSQASGLVTLRMLKMYRVKEVRVFVEYKLITETCVCTYTLLGKIDNIKIMF